MVEIELLVSLSGPEYSLSASDKRSFPGEVVDGKVTGEAGRLINAGYAKLPTVDEAGGDADEDMPAPARKPRKAN